MAEYGHARVPRSHKREDGFNFAGWVTGRRQDYKNGRLPPERIEQLEAVVGWVWEPHEADFDEGFS